MSDHTPGDELTIGQVVAFLSSDSEATSARTKFCKIVVDALSDTAAWLAVDAMLGAGDNPIGSEDIHRMVAHDRLRAFSAVSLVAQFGAELASGAKLLYDNGNTYAGAALVRQLIECEYLLRAFGIEFSEAARWYDAASDEHWLFRPKRLRKVGGFDDREYMLHCEGGGHPHPAGRPLLEVERLEATISGTPSTAERNLDVAQILRADFGMHCWRVWSVLVDVLSNEHARFAIIRSELIQSVADAHAEWCEGDGLAQHAGWLFIETDPDRPVNDVIAELTRQPPRAN